MCRECDFKGLKGNWIQQKYSTEICANLNLHSTHCTDWGWYELSMCISFYTGSIYNFDILALRILWLLWICDSNVVFAVLHKFLITTFAPSFLFLVKRKNSMYLFFTDMFLYRSACDRVSLISPVWHDTFNTCVFILIVRSCGWCSSHRLKQKIVNWIYTSNRRHTWEIHTSII